MKDKWRNYALKDGKVKSSYLREHCYRSPKRERCEASSRNRLLESRKEQIKEEISKEIYAKINSGRSENRESEDIQRGLLALQDISGEQSDAKGLGFHAVNMMKKYGEKKMHMMAQKGKKSK